MKEEESYNSSSCPDSNHPHSIDLGLPSGTLWACCNIGANVPEEYGGYFAWGETTTKNVYDWSTYQYGSGFYDAVNIGSDIAGTQYDAATANWGASWHLPSMAQIQELLDNTTSTWIILNGVSGRQFTGYNGESVFLPAAGYRRNSEIGYAGSHGRYWSSTFVEDNYLGVGCSHGLFFGSGYGLSPLARSEGFSVRPVR